MQKRGFIAVSPYELGDTVAVFLKKPGQMSVGRTEEVDFTVATITDILAINSLKTGETVFQYELDNSGEYCYIAPGCRYEKNS